MAFTPDLFHQNPHLHSHSFHFPGALTLEEESEEESEEVLPEYRREVPDPSIPSVATRAKSLQATHGKTDISFLSNFTNSTNPVPTYPLARRLQSSPHPAFFENSPLSTSQKMNPAYQQNATNLRVEPQNARRVSNVSTASARSYSEMGTPTLAMISNEREANLRTPRPQTAQEPFFTEPPQSDADARIIQWQRKEASESTLDDSRPQKQANLPETKSYASDSLGRMSVSSSARAGSVSEVSPAAYPASEVAQERMSSVYKAKKNRKVAPPEQLVIVRPPPSKQINPLNLQIQLLAPQATSNNGRSSGEVNREDATSLTGGQSSTSRSNNALLNTSPRLSRRSSTSSARSGYSETSSAGFSTLSAGSTNRRVTPLYNLCFHSILPTTITDAGTDQKVAKFGRRGVEIDGFGTLVPRELHTDVDDQANQQRNLFNATDSQIGSNSGGGSPEETSEVSQPRSLDSIGPQSLGSAPSMESEPPTSFDAMSPQAKDPSDGGVGLGGRFLNRFKKLNLNLTSGPQPAARPTASLRSGTDSTAQSTGLLSRMTGTASKVRDGHASLVQTQSGDDLDVMSTAESQKIANQLDTPQLIVGAGIRPDGTRRCIGYSWTVRKWNRRTDEGMDAEDIETPGRSVAGANPILNSVWKRFNIANRMGGNEIHPPAKDITVRFEWTRQVTRKRGVGSSTSKRHPRAATDVGFGTSQASAHGNEVREAERTGTLDSLRLPAGSRPSSMYSTGGTRHSLDQWSATGSCVSGDNDRDSDPEDSETMWSCHLVLDASTRIPIGSLRPTPHHPKLVAQLTIPYPLPDLSQSGIGVDAAGLTREELKDIISVTCLFVSVREAFGGLAKRRKGDSVLRFSAAVAQR